MANQLPGGGGDGGGSGGGGGSGDTWYDQVVNAIPGIPDALAHQVADMLRNDNSDAGWGQMFSFLRTTDWFNQAFAGFNQGVQSTLFNGAVESANDLVNTLTNYRGWRNQANQDWSQYFGRDITASELMDFGTRGYTNNAISEIGQGHSLAVSQGSQWQYYLRNFDQGGLSQNDLEAYGQFLAGKGSSLGASIDARLKAAMGKMQSLFSGQLASLGGPSTSGGFAPSLGGGQQKTDIGA